MNAVSTGNGGPAHAGSGGTCSRSGRPPGGRVRERAVAELASEDRVDQVYPAEAPGGGARGVHDHQRTLEVGRERQLAGVSGEPVPYLPVTATIRSTPTAVWPVHVRCWPSCS